MKKLIILFLFFLSCQDSNKKVIMNLEFEEVLSKYSTQYPIVKFKRFDASQNFPVPSYQVFFDKLKKDTVISIKLSPFLVGLNPMNFELKEQNDSISYEFVEPIGFFLFRNKSVIIFDENNYSKNFINRDNLITNIPDSLKFDLSKENTHIRSSSEYYKITKLSIKKIEL